MSSTPVLDQFAVRADNGVDQVAIVRNVSAAPEGAIAIVDKSALADKGGRRGSPAQVDRP